MNEWLKWYRNSVARRTNERWLCLVSHLLCNSCFLFIISCKNLSFKKLVIKAEKMKSEKCNDGMEWANEWAETWEQSFCKERNDNVDIFYNSIYFILLLFLLFCLPLRTDCVTSASNDLPQFTMMRTPPSDCSRAITSLSMQANEDDEDNIFIFSTTSTFFFDKSLWGNDVFCQHDSTINNFSSSHHSRPNKRTSERYAGNTWWREKIVMTWKSTFIAFVCYNGVLWNSISRGVRAESRGDHSLETLGRTKNHHGKLHFELYREC